MNSDDGMEKLRTYKLILKKIELKPYLEVLTDRKQKKALTAFRISAHKLQIERGRYSGEKRKIDYVQLVMILRRDSFLL